MFVVVEVETVGLTKWWVDEVMRWGGAAVKPHEVNRRGGQVQASRKKAAGVKNGCDGDVDILGWHASLCTWGVNTQLPWFTEDKDAKRKVVTLLVHSKVELEKSKGAVQHEEPCFFSFCLKQCLQRNLFQPGNFIYMSGLSSCKHCTFTVTVSIKTGNILPIWTQHIITTQPE